jgi:hypothetical protein
VWPGRPRRSTGWHVPRDGGSDHLRPASPSRLRAERGGGSPQVSVPEGDALAGFAIQAALSAASVSGALQAVIAGPPLGEQRDNVAVWPADSPFAKRMSWPRRWTSRCLSSVRALLLAAWMRNPSRTRSDPSRTRSSPSRTRSSPPRTRSSPSRTRSDPSRTRSSPSRTRSSPSRTRSDPSRTPGRPPNRPARRPLETAASAPRRPYVSPLPMHKPGRGRTPRRCRSMSPGPNAAVAREVQGHARLMDCPGNIEAVGSLVGQRELGRIHQSRT